MKKDRYNRLTEYSADDICPRCGKPFISGQDKDGNPKFYCDECLRKIEKNEVDGNFRCE